MTSATMLAPAMPKLDHRKLRAWASNQICYLTLRTRSLRWHLLEGLASDPSPEDRVLIRILSSALQLLEREMRRRALADQLAWGLASDDLDPALVAELN
jgi:hypothetical protein